MNASNLFYAHFIFVGASLIDEDARLGSTLRRTIDQQLML